MDYNVALPSKPRIVSEEEASGLYEIDGLFPGYGHTLGNSLRRIILSSLTGAAITSVKIDGVPHEFATLEGVKEDVLTILMNLKKTRLALESDEPQTISLEASGQKSVTAADLKTGSQVRILTPQQHIAELTDKKAKLSMEMTVERGLGYVPRDVLQQEKVEVGTIALDATFSPIRRVNYEVENMRVGDRTDFNRLRIFIETDGTLAPRVALEKAIEIMIYQLKAIVGFKDESEAEGDASSEEAYEAQPIEAAAEDSREHDADVLKTRVDTLDLSSRTINALSAANIRTIGGLARKKEDDILALEGVGQKGLEEIKEVLATHGVSLKE